VIRGRHHSPDWLQNRWADQKKATVARITGAIASLHQAGKSVTYRSICRSVESLYSVSISANTIKRNHEAFEIYLANRSSRRYSPAKEHAVQKLVQHAPADLQTRIASRIARLRRMRKDALIVRLVQLEDASDHQKTIEMNLRDEILRLLEKRKARGA
jgi:hypothetical protein